MNSMGPETTTWIGGPGAGTWGFGGAGMGGR